MSKSACHFLIIFFFLLSGCGYSFANQIKTLFLGNSYTYVNNLPQIIYDVALTTGDTLIFDSNTPGGYTLNQHSADNTSINKIMQGGWDYIVLQEQSQLPAFEDYDGFGALNLCSMARQYDPCARTMFYMTWGRKNGDLSNCIVWPPVCTYDGMDSLLYLRYIEMATLNKSEVSPVGAVWNYIRQNYPAIELYQPDDSHPSAAGSYAAACTFYTALFKKDPTLITYDYLLTATEAANIRHAAKLVVYDSLASFDFGDYIPHAVFNYSIGTGMNEIDFWNNSSNADSYLWDFGDGDTSTAENVIHNYLMNGLYLVTLTAYNCDQTQVNQSVHQVSINICPHNPTIYPDSLILCQNTSDTLWTQVYDSYQWIDNNGNIIPNETNQFMVATTPNFYSVITARNGCLEQSPQVYVGTYSSGLIFYWLDSVSNSTHVDTLCAGDSLILILRTNKPDTGDGIRQWMNNNTDIPGANTDTLFVNSSGDYSIRIINPNCPGGNYFESPVLPVDFVQCNIGIDETDYSKMIRVFPNPSREFMNIVVESNLVGQDFAIVNMLGVTILKGHFDNTLITLPLSEMAIGVYVLKINSARVVLIKVP